mgnify:FL=1|jgi:hypothetical protein
MNTTKTAAARLASLGTVHACAVRRVGAWFEVDATVSRAGMVLRPYAVGPTLDAALATLGC